MYLRMILCSIYTVYIHISTLCFENSYTKLRCIDSYTLLSAIVSSDMLHSIYSNTYLITVNYKNFIRNHLIYKITIHLWNANVCLIKIMKSYFQNLLY